MTTPKMVAPTLRVATHPAFREIQAANTPVVKGAERTDVSAMRVSVAHFTQGVPTAIFRRKKMAGGQTLTNCVHRPPVCVQWQRDHGNQTDEYPSLRQGHGVGSLVQFLCKERRHETLRKSYCGQLSCLYRQKESRDRRGM